MKTCSRCGTANPDDATFCLSCNDFLEWEAPGRVPDTPPAAGPSVSAPAPTPPSAPPVPTSEHPVIRPRVSSPPASALAMATQHLDQGLRLADAGNRPDLAGALAAVRSDLDSALVNVAVAGEFKRGKSTLINALLQTSVCPTDADQVTVVPTLVRFGETPSAVAHLDRDPAEVTGDTEDPETVERSPLRTEPIPVESLADWVSEAGNPGNRRRVRTVEVRLQHRILRTGLALTDTPGVGGLDSAHGVITLSALDSAQGLLFVTDASTELTAPELEFLRSALPRCPHAACVLTKTDLYPEWRRIAELDRGHLAKAGIDIPVIPVSSFLRLAARRDPSLSDESGYPALVEFLARSVMGTAQRSATARAAEEIAFATEQMGREVAAEKQVLAAPERAESVVRELASQAGRAAGLAAPSATWQQMLSDGIQDLVADVEHDLSERLRTVVRDVEAVIDDGDPAQSWDGIGVWLRRHVVAAAVANYDTLSRRAGELAADVSERFALDAGETVQADPATPPASLSSLPLASADSLSAPGGRLAALMLTTRTAAFVPMVLFGVAGGLLGAVVVAPISLALAAGIGRKMIKDERQRQLAYRRQQAKAAARRFVEETAFVMNKETRDALRRTGRQLRDDFLQRASALHRSSVNALSAAERARTLDDAQRQARVAHLDRQQSELRAVADGARLLAVQGVQEVSRG